MTEPYDKSKFDLKYMVLGKKEDVWKSLRYGLIFLLILGFGYLIYRGAEALFPKRPEQNIIAKKGSVVTVQQVNNIKKTIIPFVEVYGDSNTSIKGDGRVGIGGRIGVRFEW